MVCFNPRGAWTNDRTRPFRLSTWTQADDDKLRKLALTGLSSRAIGIRMNRTDTAVRSRARLLQVILIRLEQLQMG